MKVMGLKSTHAFLLLVVTTIFCFGCLFVVGNRSIPSAHAQNTNEKAAELAAKISEYEAQVKALQAKASTLSNQISQFNAQIQLTELKIQQTEDQIALLTGRIGTLTDSVSSLTSAFDARVIETYKLARVGGDAVIVASSSNLRDALTRYQYLVRLQAADQSLLTRLKKANDGYLSQKAQLTTLSEQLDKSKKDLNSQKVSKATLLTVTNNDEKKYQTLLAQAKSQLASLAAYAKSRGVTVLPPQSSPDGWFYSQRDERWAMACIGSSCGTSNQENVLDVGCLISSVAMVKKKYGEDVTPLTLATNSSYFYSNTAYMNSPWPSPSGYRYERSSFNQGKMDSELSAGRPVILHMQINSRDGHFIVIKSGSGGNYTMHDPIEGHDKNFGDFYRTSQVSDMSVLVKT